ncbi:MAG: hypothetical protein HFJ19_03825 [Clostridia bacterium]|nr:hypothetical protein [Clostridia bacterium]
MNFLCKVYFPFSFADRSWDEARCDYIKRKIAKAKEKVLFHHADILEFTGLMYKSDINIFKEVLDTEPIAICPTPEPYQYSVTFLVPTEKLLKED